MFKWLRDVVLIPLVITLVTGFGFMVWGAWYSGVKWHSPLSVGWLKAIFEIAVPLWLFCLTVIAAGVCVFTLFRIRGRYRSLAEQNEVLEAECRENASCASAAMVLEQDKARLEAEIYTLKYKEPVLHASWSGNSAWGWASTNFMEDPHRIYMIRGDVTLLIDNVEGPVYITGVEVEGAEPMGAFDNFMLNPGQPETRGIRLYFRGTAPQGNDCYTVQLVFKDLRGNSHPAAAHRFQPLPIPERVAYERGLLRQTIK